MSENKKEFRKKFITLKEAETYQIASDLGIAPRLLRCEKNARDDRYRDIFTERFDMDLDQLSETDPERAQSFAPAAHELLERFHQAGYLHKDIHLGNFVVKGDKLALIDFDTSRLKSELPREKICYCSGKAICYCSGISLSGVRISLSTGKPDEKLLRLFPYKPEGTLGERLEHSTLEFQFWLCKNMDTEFCSWCNLEAAIPDNETNRSICFSCKEEAKALEAKNQPQ